MQEPPKTFEEFLQSQNMDDWPKCPFLEYDLHSITTIVNRLKDDYSLESISTSLWTHVSLKYQVLMDMETRLTECVSFLEEHAHSVLDCENRASTRETVSKIEKWKEMILRSKKKKFKVLGDVKSRKNNIEGCTFPGFKATVLTDLPRHLEAAQLYSFILKFQNFEARSFKMWKALCLTEASIAIFQDCFWWCFLQNFKPNKEDQYSLFDRIAESYVSLFLSIPPEKKDAFFKIYPDCLSQAIYTAFHEAFPDSSKLFDDEFKEEIGNIIFQWFSGLKPIKGFWKKWDLDWLSKSTIYGGKKDDASVKKVAKQSVRFQMTFDLDNKIEFAQGTRASIPWEPAEGRRGLAKLEERVQSHGIGPGPEFCRVLFRLRGRSPLVSYYLQKHQVSNVLSIMPGSKMACTVLSKLPVETLTYQNVIAESKKLSRKNRMDHQLCLHKLNEEIAVIERKQKNAKRKLERLKQKALRDPYTARQEGKQILSQLHSSTWLKESPVSPKPTHGGEGQQD
ncbi:protein FAM227B [Tachyglossus aculeatus]|uniref:protein FAM227B n=1 Tax=Tachyglossus aculeatus TaxID=9261 RepID=UPI0018F30677|nr:protein FAM227B [Tachyglossus aculeatus]